MPLRDASFHGRVRGLPAAATIPSQFWQSPIPPNFDGGTAPVPLLKVYLNYGRWIAECPDCHGAQLACFEDQRFLCNECGNVAVGNLWRALEWPSNRPAIEDAVIARPEKNQNWLPGETVADLKQESLSHGKV